MANLGSGAPVSLDVVGAGPATPAPTFEVIGWTRVLRLAEGAARGSRLAARGFQSSKLAFSINGETQILGGHPNVPNAAVNVV